MSKNLFPTQSQAQAQSFGDLTEPQGEMTFLGKLLVSLADQLVLNVVDLRITQIRYSLFQNVPSLLQLPRDPSLPEGTTQEGLVLSLSQERLKSLVLLLRLVL